MECRDAPANDLSRSLVALDQNSTIIAVVELSQSSWLVGGMLPGIERQRHLRHLLANYHTYYNGARTHLALDKDSPLHRPAQTVGRIASVTWLGGLHRHYVRMA
jgi:transposase